MTAHNKQIISFLVPIRKLEFNFLTSLNRKICKRFHLPKIWYFFGQQQLAGKCRRIVWGWEKILCPFKWLNVIMISLCPLQCRVECELIISLTLIIFLSFRFLKITNLITGMTQINWLKSFSCIYTIIIFEMIFLQRSISSITRILNG